MEDHVIQPTRLNNTKPMRHCSTKPIIVLLVTNPKGIFVITPKRYFTKHNTATLFYKTNGVFSHKSNRVLSHKLDGATLLKTNGIIYFTMIPIAYIAK